MKSNALAKAIESYAKQSPQNNAHDWSALARVLASGKTKPISDFATELCGLASSLSEGASGLGALLPEMQVMRATATVLGKAPFAEAVEYLERLAEQYPRITAEAIEASINERAAARAPTRQSARQTASRDPALVTGYNSRLEEALGDESGFDSVVTQLEADKRLAAADFKQLAKAFTGRATKNKGDALEAIRARQRNLMDARAKQRFNDGRTAA